jgi:adenylosuccinate synthase
MTKLDVYDGMDEIKICTAYNVTGQERQDFPSTINALNKAQPILKSFPGWTNSVKDSRSYDALPAEARSYIEFVEQQLQTPVDIVSVGPGRSQSILRRNPWTPS